MRRRRPAHHQPTFVVFLSFFALLAIGCGGGVASPSGTPVSMTASATPEATASGEAPSATSAPTGKATPDRSPVRLLELDVTVEGDRRWIKVYVPDPMPTGKVPLVLFLHAAGETPTTAVRDTRFDRVAGREGFIVAFPPAKDRAWDVQVTPGLSEGPVDERYLAGMLDYLIEELPIDASRVYVTGFSFGAAMADRVACRSADRVAAAAVVSGSPWVGGRCAPSRPVSMLVMHGTGDATFRYGAARELVDTWLDLDACQPLASPAPIGGDAVVATATGCADGTTVRLVTVNGGWHTWFTAPDATELVWRFFSEQDRR